MDTSELRAITLEALDQETASLIKETHPQIVAAHGAAIENLRDGLHEIEHSTRLQLSLQG